MRFQPVYLFLLAAGAAFAAADSGRMIQKAELRAEPFSDAALVTELPAESSVSVLERKGGWYKVKSSDGEGWTRMTAVRLGSTAAAGGGSSGLGATVQFLTTGRSGSSGVTAATGIKGITRQEVLGSAPDHRALQDLDRYAASARDARDFAANGHLAANKVDYPSGSAGGGSRDSAPAGDSKSGAF